MKNKYLNIKDNPNPAANIGFICYTPFHFYLYKNIYQYLPNSEFIIGEPYDSEEFGRISNYLENLLDFFSTQKVYWRFINLEDERVAQNEFYNKYALLVSTLYYGATAAPYNKDKKLVRVMYTQAKDLWNFGPWSAYFDLILAYGSYSQKFLSIYNNSVVAGNPKFDDWFSNEIDEESLEELKNSLDPAKKTVLYLPTTGMLSSLNLMTQSLNSVSDEYNIIVKAHHDTYLYEQDRLAPYKENSRIIIKSDRDDILPLLKVADFVISDNSGAIFDAILADRPIILIDFLNEDFFKRFKETWYYKFEGKYLGVATNQQSIEQMVKNPSKEVGPVIKIRSNVNQNLKIGLGTQVSVDNLRESLAFALQNEGIFSRRREKIRELAFSYNDGQCSKRAAEKITKLLYTPKSGPNFFAEALDRYYDQFIARRLEIYEVNSRVAKHKLGESTEYYLKIKSLPFWQKMIAVMKEFF